MVPRDAHPGEVEVIQYLRPDGRQRIMYAPVGEEVAALAQDMRISAEELNTGMIAIYVRWKWQKSDREKINLAINGPGPNGPVAVLIAAIRELAAKRPASKVKK